MADNWWESDAVVGQPSAPSTPRVMTVGTPRPEKPNIPSGYRPTDGGGLTPIQGGPADPYRPGGELDPNKPQKGDESSVAQSRAAGFLDRAAKANQLYEATGVGAPSYVRAIGQAVLPNEALNALTGDDRQKAEAYQRDFVMATLRLESGAAIPPEELTSQIRTYFPIAGDSEETIKAKAELRRNALESMRIQSGGPVTQGQVQAGEASGGGKQLTREQQAAYDALVSSGATPQQIQAYLQGIGFDIQNAEEVATARDKGAGFVPAEGARYDLNAEQQAEVDRIAAQNQSGGAFGAGAGDAVSFGTMDEIGATLGAVSQSLGGNGSFSENYDNNIAVNRAVLDRLASESPLAFTGGQIAGGFAIPIGAGANTARQMAALGGVQGAAYGFGSGEGGFTDRLPSAAAGGAVGATVGGTLGLAARPVANTVNRFTSRPSVAARQQEAAEALPIIEAGQRQNIPIRQPDARPSVRADFAAAEASETGNPIITRAIEGDKAAVQNRVREVGGDGIVLDDFDMGQRIQEGGRSYLARTKSQANALYTRAEQMAGDAQGIPQNALNMLELNISELKEAGERTNAGAIKYLEDLKADLQGGASITKLRNIRKNMRGQINERNLTHTDTERRVGEVIDQLSRDIEGILPANAKAAFRSADDFYRERMTFKTQVIERFIGPKNNPISPEQAAARFNSFMKSKDFGRFQRMMKELEPGDRADIAATVAENLGTARNGEFSFAALSTNIDKFSPRAIKELFGEDGARAIADLKIIARAKADTLGSLNKSRTAVVNERNGLRDIMFGIFGGGVAGIPGAIGGFFARGAMEKLTNARAARLLLNPDFTKWLRQTPQTSSPAAINRHFARLTQAASRDAVFAADVKALQQVLTDSFSRAPVRAAASQEEND